MTIASPTLLRRAVAPHLGEGATFEPIPSGKFNTSFFVTAGGRDYVLRVAPPDDAGFLFYERGMMAQEPGLHRLLREKTDVPVAAIVAHDTSRAVVARDFLLIERLPGTALSDAPVPRAAAGRLFRQVGAALRKIHALTAERHGYLGEHRCMEPQKTWREAFHVMWNKLLDDVEVCGGYTPRETGLLRDLLDRAQGHFTHEPPASLLHMDVWAQNILCDRQGNLTGLVDFDRALWGDPEIEFAVLDYCGVSTPEFWEGYGKPRLTDDSARVRNLFYHLYEIQKYIVIERLRRNNPARADAYRAEALHLAHGAAGG